MENKQVFKNLQTAKVANKASLYDVVETIMKDEDAGKKVLKLKNTVVEYGKTSATAYISPEEMKVIAEDVVTGNYKNWDHPAEYDKEQKKYVQKPELGYQYMVRGGGKKARDITFRIFDETYRGNKTTRVSITVREGTPKKVGDNGAIMIEKVTGQAYTKTDIKLFRTAMYQHLDYHNAMTNYQYRIAREKGLTEQYYWNVTESENFKTKDLTTMTADEFKKICDMVKPKDYKDVDFKKKVLEEYQRRNAAAS